MIDKAKERGWSSKKRKANPKTLNTNLFNEETNETIQNLNASS